MSCCSADTGWDILLAKRTSVRCILAKTAKAFATQQGKQDNTDGRVIEKTWAHRKTSKEFGLQAASRWLLLGVGEGFICSCFCSTAMRNCLFSSCAIVFWLKNKLEISLRRILANYSVFQRLPAVDGEQAWNLGKHIHCTECLAVTVWNTGHVIHGNLAPRGANSIYLLSSSIFRLRLCALQTAIWKFGRISLITVNWPWLSPALNNDLVSGGKPWALVQLWAICHSVILKVLTVIFSQFQTEIRGIYTPGYEWGPHLNSTDKLLLKGGSGLQSQTRQW